MDMTIKVNLLDPNARDALRALLAVLDQKDEAAPKNRRDGRRIHRPRVPFRRPRSPPLRLRPPLRPNRQRRRPRVTARRC